MISEYRDKFNLITQANGDGGDTCQRTASYYLAIKLLGYQMDDLGVSVDAGFLYDTCTLRHSYGRYRRHVDGRQNIAGRWHRWYANPDNFSRDQSIVLQSAFIVFNMKYSLLELFKARAKRLFFHFNTESYDDHELIKKKIPDAPSPIEFAQFIRGLKAWYLYPLLYLLDLQLVFDVCITRYINPWDSDNMILPILVSSLHRYPTFVGKFARWIYSFSNAKDRISAYYSEENGQNGLRPLGELLCKLFDKEICK